LHRVHVAEQVSVARTPERVAALMRHSEPGWLDTLAALGWREGEVADALRTRSERNDPCGAPEVVFTVGDEFTDPPAILAVSVRWNADGATRLFREFTGDIIVYRFAGMAVVAMLGSYESLESGDEWTDVAAAERTGTASRPAEVAVRAFLGHLRTALEGF
jgi:hypothetical protein